MEMYGTINSSSVREVPCALKPFLNDGANGQVLRSLSHHGCLLYFLDWVKTSRRNAPDIDAEELLMCPMLWCRKRMKDADATVRHISKCSHLSNGYYWCPHCRGPERFVEYDQGRENVPKTRLHKIDKTLAIKFFKWLIPRRSFKRTGNRSDASETANSDVSSPELLSPQRADGLSLQEMFGSTPSDLAGRGSDTIYSRDHGTQLFVSPNGNFDDPASTDIEFPCGDPVYYTTELRDRTSFIFASAQHANSSTNSSGLQAGSSHGRACPDATIHGKKFIRDSRLVVDRSACSSSYDCCEKNADTCASTPTGLQITPPSTPSSSLIFPLSSVPSSGSERRHIPFQCQSPGAEAYSSHVPDLSGPLVETRIQVQELLDLISIIKKEWVEGLCPGYEVHRRCSSLSARLLFAKGINTLKTWFGGRELKRTFEEVFSSMHIALAAAYYLHHDDESYCWDAFFQDALLFQHALVDEEKRLFVMAIDRWRWLPDQQIPSINATFTSSIIRHTRQKLSDSAAMLQKLRDTKVFRVCAGFLDSFENAFITEKNLSFPGAAKAAQNNLSKIDELIEKTIQPLKERRGIEAFQANFMDARDRIRNGTLGEIREVEVHLVYSGRASARPPLELSNVILTKLS